MKNLSRNSRKNKRKKRNKIKRKASNENFINSRMPTVFNSGYLGISLQKMWINEHIKTLVSSAKENDSDFVLVTPLMKDKMIVSNVMFLKYCEFKQADFINSKQITEAICSYYEAKRKEGTLIVFFLNDEGRLSCYSCNADVICTTEARSSSFYEIQEGEIRIDFELMQWLFDLSDDDIVHLKKLEYFPVNERIKDLSGKFRELDPVLVALFDFITGCIQMFEEAKKDGFSKALFMFDGNGLIINIYDKETLLRNIVHGKSIFKKIAPETFRNFFEEENSVQNAS